MMLGSAPLGTAPLGGSAPSAPAETYTTIILKRRIDYGPPDAADLDTGEPAVADAGDPAVYYKQGDGTVATIENQTLASLGTLSTAQIAARIAMGV